MCDTEALEVARRIPVQHRLCAGGVAALVKVNVGPPALGMSWNGFLVAWTRSRLAGRPGRLRDPTGRLGRRSRRCGVLEMLNVRIGTG
jgi:hypothetical protein